MNNPVFTNKGSRYLFDWQEYSLQAEVSRINANHQTTKCQVIFTTNDPEANPHLLQTRFNLDSSRARSELAKDMSARYTAHEPIDWKKLLEYLSIKTLREFEKGEPIVQITSQDETKPLEYLIYPIAPLNKPTVIFGEPGAGKSQLAVVFNILIVLPWTQNPLRLLAPTRPIKGLFLDYEADEDDIRRQLTSLAKGMNLPIFTLNYRRCSLPLADDIEAIRNHIDETGTECLFIDSMSLAAGGDLNRMDVATAYFRALRQLKGITSISFAHTSKDREIKNKTIMGSVLWEAGARSVWELRGEGEDDTLNLALFHRKSNLSKKSKPLGYRINYENDLPVSIEWFDPKSIPEFLERMDTSQRIIELLKTITATDEEIAKHLGISLGSCRTALSRLKKKNITAKSSELWGLTPHF